jgi:hypothetical protein
MLEENSFLAASNRSFTDQARDSEHLQNVTIVSCDEVLFVSEAVLFNDLLETVRNVRISSDWSCIFCYVLLRLNLNDLSV